MMYTSCGDGFVARLWDAFSQNDEEQFAELLHKAISLPGPHRPILYPQISDAGIHILLTTNDGGTFLPERGFITEHSGLIRELLADADADGDVVKEAVPLRNVAARELTRMLWLLGQGLDAKQLERCITAFDIESVVSLQQAANFMDVRRITAVCAGVIARLVQEAAGNEEKAQLLDLVTPPRLPQELCEQWLGRQRMTGTQLVSFLAQHLELLLTPLAQWDAAWAHGDAFSAHPFKPSEVADAALLKARSALLTARGLSTPLFIMLNKTVNDDDMLSLAQLEHVGKLVLWGCSNITDAGLEVLTKFKGLTSLNLWECYGITESGISHVSSLRSLEFLDMSHCKGVGHDGWAHLSHLTNLTTLNLGGCCQITNDDLMFFKELSQLTSLDLSECDQITENGLAFLVGLKQLTSLDLRECIGITDLALVHVASMFALASLNLAWCEEVTAAGLSYLTALSQLSSLNLERCHKTTDAGLPHVAALPRLSKLDLSDCHTITDAGLAHIKTMSQLTTLNLSGCDKITDAGLAHLKMLSELRFLGLSNCKLITDVGLVHTASLRSLQMMHLHGCDEVTEEGRARLRLSLPYCSM